MQEVKAGLSVDELEAGIRNEYAKNYLWTGDINEALYEVSFVSKRRVRCVKWVSMQPARKGG